MRNLVPNIIRVSGPEFMLAMRQKDRAGQANPPRTRTRKRQRVIILNFSPPVLSSHRFIIIIVRNKISLSHRIYIHT